jgi:predicted nucleic acid-binding protein
VKTVFVDANVFLRVFTRDSEREQERAASLFQQAAEGHLSLITGPPVLFEIAWSLRTAYGLPREKVLDYLASIRGIPGLRLLDADLVADALDLARRMNSDFADAYIQVSAQKAGADELATFNRKHFERLGAKLKDL